jgi:hypothetical protein
MKSIYFPDKEYSAKEELFKDLRENADDIISLKKAQIQKSCEKGLSVTCKSLDLLKFTDQLKGIKIDDNFYYIAVNTTRILDSHDDLHLDGLWNKSIKDQQFKNYLIADHDLELSKVIVKKEYVEMFVTKIPFALLGKDYEGETQALIYKVPKDKIINQVAKEWLESGDDIEASVRMQYVSLFLAYDSLNPEDAAAKANYDNYIDTIANKKDFEYIPYFFGIKEAKNVRESSLVVFGSNSVTGVVTNNNKQAEKSLDDNKEPSIDTQTSKRRRN